MGVDSLTAFIAAVGSLVVHKSWEFNVVSRTITFIIRYSRIKVKLPKGDMFCERMRGFLSALNSSMIFFSPHMLDFNANICGLNLDMYKYGKSCLQYHK